MWNPPWLLLWLSPMLFPPFPVSALAWMGLNIALLLAGALLARGGISAGTRLEPRAAWLAVGLFVPSLFALKSGQIRVIHLVGTAGSLVLTPLTLQMLAVRDPFWAGAGRGSIPHTGPPASCRD